MVDDGSGDGTPAYLAAIADPRLKVLRNETAQGAAAARNRGLAAAGAPVTAFLDDDDELLPGFLAASLTAHRQAPAPDLCWTGVLYALPDGREEVERWERWSGSQRFVIRLAGCCGSPSARRRCAASAVSILPSPSPRIRISSCGWWRRGKLALPAAAPDQGACPVRCQPQPLGRCGPPYRPSAAPDRPTPAFGRSDPAIWRRCHSSLAMHFYRAGRLGEARGELFRLLARPLPGHRARDRRAFRDQARLALPPGEGLKSSHDDGIPLPWRDAN